MADALGHTDARYTLLVAASTLFLSLIHIYLGTVIDGLIDQLVDAIGCVSPTDARTTRLSIF